MIGERLEEILLRRGLWKGLGIESVLQDGADAAIAAIFQSQGAKAGGLQAGGAVGFGQAEQS